MKLLRRRAVSPIIATLLLIAIAVASGVIVYVFTSGVAGNLTRSGGNQVTEQMNMDAYSYSPVSGGVTVYVRNTGSSSVTINTIYFDGAVVTSPGGTCVGASVTPTSTCTVVITGSPYNAETAGTTHAVKAVSSDGGIFDFNVIAGQTG